MAGVVDQLDAGRGYPVRELPRVGGAITLSAAPQMIKVGTAIR